MTKQCECGATSHQNQVRQLPIDSVVVAKVAIKTVPHLEPVPVGTKGFVTGHCDDGRAWIFFQGFSGGHTFHAPDAYVEIVESEAGKLKRMLATVLDANYGTSYHHIGDGDGIPENDAEEIRLWWKDHLEKIVEDWKASQGVHQNA